MEDKFKVALYIRVSTERQANEGDSLEEQETELKKFCDYRNYQIHNIYIERGKSGGNTNRPEYQKLIKDVEKKKINAIVVKKLDRLSRSLLDFENLMKLMQQNDVEFISLKENFDTTNAMGKAMLRVALVFAQLEREQTSERIVDVMNHRANQGLFNGGRRIYGYSIIEKELVPYPKEKQIIEIIFQKFLETHSTGAVASFLNENNLKNRENKPWDIRHIYKLLQQKVYIGKINWKNQVYNGIQQPLISKITFEKVQQIIQSRTYTKNIYSNNLLLTKKVYCLWCGSPLAPSHTINRHNKKYFYYRCTGSKNIGNKCKNSHFSTVKLETEVSRIILSLSEEKQFSLIENKLLKHNEAINISINEQEKALLYLETNLTQLKLKKDKYLDGLLSSEFIKQEKDLIHNKIQEIEGDEKTLKASILKQQLLINEAKETLINITEIKKLLISYKSDYPFTDIRHHKLSLSKIIESIYCGKDSLEIKFLALPWKEVFEVTI